MTRVRLQSGDYIDVPDEREPEHNIPDAVCDAQTVLGDELTIRVGHWLTERLRVNAAEDRSDASSDDWHYSDDEAADIVHGLAALFEILPIIPVGTVVQSQGSIPHVGVVIEPVDPWFISHGYVLVHWTHDAGICDEWHADLTILGESFDSPDPDGALTADECEAANLPDSRDM